MKTRDWCMVLVVLTASFVVAGCGDYKRKYVEADARAIKATTSLDEARQDIEKVKAECVQLQTSLKQKTDQLAAVTARNTKASNDYKAEIKKVSDDLKAARDQVAAITKELGLATAKAKDAEQLSAKVQALEQANKQMQAVMQSSRSGAAPRAVPKAEPNTPAPK